MLVFEGLHGLVRGVNDDFDSCAGTFIFFLFSFSDFFFVSFRNSRIVSSLVSFIIIR